MPRTPRMRVTLVALALSISVAMSAAAAPPAAVPGELIVRFRPGASAMQKTAALARVPASTRLRDFDFIDAALVRFSGMSTEHAISELRNDPGVLYAEPNYEVHLDRVPDDPRFPELYAMRNLGQTGGLPGADIRATLAWDLFTGDPNLKLGVIDTGIDWTHPDLAANIWTNPGEIAGNGIDDDHNGYVDDIHGWDAVNHDGNPMDDHGHGTHCSGTIAGVGDNGVGVVGVNWHLKLVGIKFLNSGGSGTTAGAIEAVQYAIAAGVRLTSNSWGGGAYSAALLDAINAAGAAGQLFIAAAGNASTNTDFSPVYPADYDTPYVISVGATDHNDQLAFFSNYGVNSVDLAAPGVDILSTFLGGGYATLSGTSMACPHTSGVFALAAGRFPLASNLQLRDLVLSTCDSIPSLAGLIHGARRLNAFQAILLPDSLPPAAVTDLSLESGGSTALGLTWTATGDDDTSGTAAGYDLRYSLAPIDTGNFASATPASTGSPLHSGLTEHVEVEGLAYNSTYYFALRVLDELGNASPMSNLATGATVGIPQIEVSPGSLTESVLTGDVTVQHLTVRNVGSGRLDFDATAAAESLLAGALARSAVTIDPEPGPGHGADPRPGVVGGRGPDRGGYRWRTSDDPGGPAFGWLDITQNGTPVAFASDDDLSGPVPLGFEFPYYGRKLSSVRIGSNGYVTFGGNGTWIANGPLPTASVPADLVAPWWQDLGAGGPRSVLFQRERGRFVVSYLDVPTRGSSVTRRSFQVVLLPSGRILFQYLSLGSTPNEGTVGIQDPTHTTGLLVAFDTPFVHDRQAIEFLPAGQWLGVSPLSGRVAAGESLQLDVTFDASGLYGGDYHGAVRIDSNDPVYPATFVSSSLHVTGAPDIALSPDSLDYGGLFIGATRVDSVRVRNAGTDVLHVTSVSCTPSVFTVPGGAFDLPPTTEVWLPVSFAPTDAIAYSGTLTVTSDDHDEPTASVRLNGLGLVPPDIAVAPSLVSADLFTGATAERTFTISNTGGSDLDFRVRAHRASGSMLAPASLVVPVDIPETLRVVRHNIEDPRASAPVVRSIYTGTHLSFGISDLGEVMPFQFPVGNEHLALGTFLDGYTLAYMAAGIDRIAYSVYAYRSNIVPFSYQEIENSPTRAIVDVVTHTADGYLAVHRRFTFRKDEKLIDLQTSVENISGLVVSDVVFKEDADWDVDGTFFDTWNYDRDRNLVYASSTRFVGIASEQTPAVMDIDGWSDFNRRATVVDIPTGPVVNYDGLELLHFELGTLAPAQSADVHLAYGAANSLTELQGLMDDAVVGPSWLTLEPLESLVPAGGSLVVHARFDATGLNGGVYTADIHVTSNDPDESDLVVGARLQVTGAADIVVAPDSVDFGYPFAGNTRTDTLLVRNTGTDVLHIAAISTTGAPFFTSDGPGSLAPGASRSIAVRYAPTVRGEYHGALVIASNDPDESSFHVVLSGFARVPPDIAVAPQDVSADLLTGDVDTRTITITNSDQQELFWSATVGTPSVVATSPVFGASAPQPDKSPISEPPPPPSGDEVYHEPLGPLAHLSPIHAPGFVVQDGTLEAALANLDAGASDIAAAVPNRYEFGEGVVGDNIGDGGNDMYDNGNFLGTNLGGALLYSDGVVTGSPFFGAGGRYFTRKYPGLFVLAADNVSASSFLVLGNLGADGSGNVDGSVLQVASAGVTYRGFVKRVYNAFDPSVNHMVIVADAPTATHSFSTNTNDDFHEVAGLQNTRRIYYLLYAAADGGYIDDAAALQIMKTFLRVLRPIGPWLEVTPSVGVLSPGGHADLTARFRAAGLVTGDYQADVHIASDDPDEPDLVTHARLHVTGAPDILVEPDSIAFATTFVGSARLDTVEVTNIGTDLLSVSAVTSSSGHFQVPGGGFDLAPGASRLLTVSFAPTSPGSLTGTLTVLSNDHDQPSAIVDVRGEALIPPDIEVPTDSLVADLFTGDTTRTTLTLRNVGGSDLTFDIQPQPAALSAAALAALQAAMPPPGAEPSGGVSHPPTPSRPGDPPVVRTSVAGAPTLLITTSDVYYSVQRALGELGVAYDYVLTDQFASVPLASYKTIIVSMTGGYPGVADVQALASAAAAGKQLILLGGTDYSPYYSGVQAYLLQHTGQQGWTTSTTPHLTVTDPLDPLATGIPSPNTFSNFEASYYMLRVADPAATVVAVNGDGHPALLHKSIGAGSLVYFTNVPDSYFWHQERDYAVLRQVIQNALAWGGASWLSFIPRSGAVPAGGQLDVVARFDAARLIGGDYRALVHVQSNDPDEPDVTRPAHLHVTGRPDIAVTPDSIAFGNLFIGLSRVDTVQVHNDGTDVLHVSGVATAPPFSAPAGGFDLSPGASRDLLVTFTPTTDGSFANTMHITSDDFDEPSVAVQLSGDGLIPPDIEVPTDSLVADLFTGDTTRTTLTLRNVGGSNLTFDIQPQSAALSAAALAALQAAMPPPGAEPSGGVSHPPTPSRPGDPPVVRTSVAGASTLLITTSDVYYSVQRALSELGVAYDYVFTDHFASVPFAPYKTIIVAMDGGGSTEADVQALAGAAAAGRQLIMLGGTNYPPYYNGVQAYLLQHTGQQGWITSTTPHLTVTDPLDPLATGIPSPNTFSNFEASYYMLRVADPAATVVAVNGDGHPALLHKSIGAGSLVYFTNPPDSYFWSQERDYAVLRQVIQNALAWGGASWLSFIPRSGAVPAGGQLDVVARFDAARLIGGDYRALVHVRSNDPDEPDVTRPAHLHVTGVPNIAIAPDSLAFGSLFVGAVRADSITVSNIGTDVLHVTAITATPSHFHAPPPLDLAVGESRTLPVTFAPTAPGVYAGTLEFTSNAHNAPTITALLFGEGLVAPDIAATPESLTVRLNSGDITSLPLTLQNTGGSELTWISMAVNVTALAQSPAFSAVAGAPAARPVSAGPGPVMLPVKPPVERTYTELLAPAEPPAPATTPVLGAGRAALALDGGGLLAGDPVPAPEAPGVGPGSATVAATPAAAIAPDAIGTLEVVRGALDAGVGSVTSLIPQRYDFLEGESGNSIVDGGSNMYDGGNYLYGNYGALYYTNGPIVSEPAFGAGGRYFTRKYPGLFVLAADLSSIGAFSVYGNLGANGTGSVDGSVYQVTLGGVAYRAFVKRTWATGGPTVNHMVIVANATGSTHTFATNTGDDYHQVAGIAASPRLYYLVFSSTGGFFINNLAIQQILVAFLNVVNQSPSWLAVDPVSGSTPAGGSSPLNVHFDATGLLGGDYRGAIEVMSNDPDENPFLVPVSMHVTGVPRIVTTRDTIAFGTLFTGASRDDSLVVRNTGTDVLSVTGISAAPGVFTVPTTPFDLPPGAQRTLGVHYAPTVPGSSTGALTLLSNDPLRPSAQVVLTGNAIEAPIAGVAPPSLSFTVPEGGQQQHTLTLSNTGGSGLVFSVGSTAASVVTWTAVMPEAIRVSKTLPAPRDAQRPPRATLATAVVPEPDATGNKVLVIADGGTQADVIPVLTSAGYVVTQVIDDSVYDGSNPPLTGFNLVVLLDGPGVTSDMPAGGQNAIKNFVMAGGGMISTEWLAYEVANFSYAILQPLIPLTWGAYGEGVFTWNVTTAHPVTAGVSPSFNVSTSADLGTVNSGTALVTSASGNPMVIVKQVGSGHVVHFSCGGNYNGFHPFTVPNMQLLLLNAANWITGATMLSTSPSVGTVPAHGSLDLTVTADAGLLHSGTYINTLVIATNDPAHPVLSVPANVTVTAAPDISMSPDTLRTSQVVGASRLDTVMVSNPGSLTLHVASVTTAAPFSAPAAGFDLAPGASRMVPVTFSPTATGTFLGSLSIASDDPDEPTASVALKGVGLAAGLREDAAAAALEPPALSLALHGLVPNPPVRDLMVSFTLPDAGPATVELMDLAGRRVREVDAGAGGPGRRSISLGSVGSLPSGVYLLRLRHGGQSLVRKCVLMR